MPSGKYWLFANSKWHFESRRWTLNLWQAKSKRGTWKCGISVCEWLTMGLNWKQKKIPGKLFFKFSSIFPFAIRTDWVTERLRYLFYIALLFLCFQIPQLPLHAHAICISIWNECTLCSCFGWWLHSYFKIEMILAIKELCCTSGATTGQIKCRIWGQGKKTEWEQVTPTDKPNWNAELQCKLGDMQLRKKERERESKS